MRVSVRSRPGTIAQIKELTRLFRSEFGANLEPQNPWRG